MLFFRLFGPEGWLPVTRAFLDCPFFQGWSDVVVALIDCCSVLLGNVNGAIMPDSKDTFNVPCVGDLSSVATRSQSSRESKLTAVSDLNITNEEFIKLQEDCPTLKDIRDYAKN